jgi:hypothetical protein
MVFSCCLSSSADCEAPEETLLAGAVQQAGCFHQSGRTSSAKRMPCLPDSNYG